MIASFYSVFNFFKYFVADTFFSHDEDHCSRLRVFMLCHHSSTARSNLFRKSRWQWICVFKLWPLFGWKLKDKWARNGSVKSVVRKHTKRSYIEYPMSSNNKLAYMKSFISFFLLFLIDKLSLYITELSCVRSCTRNNAIFHDLCSPSLFIVCKISLLKWSRTFFSKFSTKW